jgi:SAM-dependent methyltransferase
MSRSLRNYPNYRLHIRLALLAALSLVAVTYQVRFSWDVIRALWRPDGIARVPFGFEMPPTINRVEPEADAIQVRNGDKLLAVNGQQFRGIATLSRAVARSRPGETLIVTILRPNGRGEEARTVSIRLAQWQQGVGRAGWLLAFVLDLLLPGMCLLLGVWVAAVRPTKKLAWLLLVLMLSFTQLLSPHRRNLSRNSKMRNDMLPWALKDVDLGQNVLEVGPGPGLTTDLLRTRLDRITALEVDSALADLLKRRMSGTNVTVIQGDASAMPFEDATFSGAVAFTMLHHVPSPTLQDRLLREVHRVLRSGGMFVGTDSLWSPALWLFHIGDTLVPVDPRGFKSRLESAGFSDVQIELGTKRFRFSARRA